MRLNNQNGFTLVEVVIVIGIVAAMSAVAMPMLFSKAPTWRLREAARDAYGMMMKARGEAVTSGVNCVVDFNPPNNPPCMAAGSPVVIAYLDFGGDFVCDNDDTPVKIVNQWPSGITLNSAVFSAGGGRFAFLPNAFPVVSSPVVHKGNFLGGHVEFSNLKGETMEVVLNQTGRFSIQ
jgi:prepilin-type N-terminal cleavage/methylation domain-containing protein